MKSEGTGLKGTGAAQANALENERGCPIEEIEKD